MTIPLPPKLVRKHEKLTEKLFGLKIKITVFIASEYLGKDAPLQEIERLRKFEEAIHQLSCIL